MSNFNNYRRLPATLEAEFKEFFKYKWDTDRNYSLKT